MKGKVFRFGLGCLNKSGVMGCVLSAFERFFNNALFLGYDITDTGLFTYPYSINCTQEEFMVLVELAWEG